MSKKRPIVRSETISYLLCKHDWGLHHCVHITNTTWLGPPSLCPHDQGLHHCVHIATWLGPPLLHVHITTWSGSPTLCPLDWASITVSTLLLNWGLHHHVHITTWLGLHHCVHITTWLGPPSPCPPQDMPRASLRTVCIKQLPCTHNCTALASRLNLKTDFH